MVDQGYIDSQDREVIIIFQNKMPKSATDILSKETFKVDKELKITAPAGSMRFIDVVY